MSDDHVISVTVTVRVPDETWREQLAGLPPVIQAESRAARDHMIRAYQASVQEYVSKMVTTKRHTAKPPTEK